MEKASNSHREVVKKQIIKIRDSGPTNMFDITVVQRLADQRHFFELVCFIEDQPERYFNFIMTGDENLLPE